MEDYNDDSLLLDGVEDEYISVRETPSLRASKLTDEFIKSDSDWTYRSKRLFNMKLRRYGRRSPEMLNPVDGTSLANITERLTHLARIRSYTPKIRKSRHPSAFESEQILRLHLPAPRPLAPPLSSFTGALIDPEEFKRYNNAEPKRPFWNDQTLSVFWQAEASLKTFITEAILGLEASLVRTVKNRKLLSLTNPLIQVDAKAVKSFLYKRSLDPIIPLVPPMEDTKSSTSQDLEGHEIRSGSDKEAEDSD